MKQKIFFNTQIMKAFPLRNSTSLPFTNHVNVPVISFIICIPCLMETGRSIIFCFFVILRMVCCIYHFNVINTIFQIRFTGLMKTESHIKVFKIKLCTDPDGYISE